MDARASRYAAAIRQQASRTEIIADLANMVKEMLKTYYHTSGKKPERILFYRDGVSEGQFEQVLKGEIKAVKCIYFITLLIIYLLRINYLVFIFDN